MKADDIPDLWTESSKAVTLADIRKINRKDAAETLKDIFFPKRCPVCGGEIPIESRIRIRNYQKELYRMCAKKKAVPAREEVMRLFPAHICRECIGRLSFIEVPFCRKCGKQLSEDLLNHDKASDNLLCGDCAKKERSFVMCRSVLNYGETEREITAELKYHGKAEYAELLSLLAAERLHDWIVRTEPDIIVPVPVHSERLRERGYNQAGLIAAKIGEIFDIPVRTDIMYREKKTRAQKELNADERLYNLMNAFKADAGKLRQAGDFASSGKRPRVLIADDIYTTGATMELCTLALLSAGAESVYGICICAGQDSPKININQRKLPALK